MKKVPLVEELMLQGFCQRYQQQFGSDLIIANSSDQVQQLQLRASGQHLTYPFAYAKINSASSPEADHYASRYLTRHGLTVQTGNEQNTAYNIRLLPCHYELEVTYETNKARGDNSVSFYAKRWLFAARTGALKFSINFGQVNLRIGAVLDLSVSIPSDRPSPGEAEATYKVVTNCTLKGYMSEAQLRKEAGNTTIEIAALMNRDSFWEYPLGD